ncbi:hypothetical protein L4C36_02500 [Photobacterium japonica]|uniref:hypothetical protein n=1 Tax=Photobacterium japonica TaxID=2910235 RepID=UPI003D12928B
MSKTRQQQWTRFVYAISGVALVTLVGCDTAKEPSSPQVDPQTEQAAMPASEAEASPVQLPHAVDMWQSPEQVVLGKVPLHLGAELWLNSMPVIGDDGANPARKLFASIRLLAADHQSLPKGIDITQVLLEQGEQQWLVQQQLDIRRDGSKSLEVALRGGPEWLPDSEVNVAVTVLYQGQEHIVIQKAVVISQVF